MAQTIKYKIVKTRKPHTCFSCLRSFPVGASLHHWTGIYEGDFNSVYYCDTCRELMDMDKESSEFPEGYVHEMLNKGETPEELIVRVKEESEQFNNLITKKHG